MSHPVVIVGASMGGLRMAESLRRFGYAGAITVIGDEPHTPYNRPPLSKAVLAETVSHVIVRPSGTEPKLKIYIDASVRDGSGRTARAAETVAAIEADLRAFIKDSDPSNA